MDKRFLTFWLVVALIWLGWIEVTQRMFPPRKKPIAKQGAPAAKADPTKDALVKAAQKDAPADVAADSKAEPKDKPTLQRPEPEEQIALRNDLMLGEKPADDAKDPKFDIFAKLTNRGAAVTFLQLNGYKDEVRKGPLVLLTEETPGEHSFLLDVISEKPDGLDEKIWEVAEASSTRVVFRTFALDGRLKVEKRYSLDEHSPMIGLEMAFENVSDELIDEIKYTLTSGNGLPIEGKWYTHFYRRAVAVMTPVNGAAAYLAEQPAYDVATAAVNQKTSDAYVSNNTNTLQLGGVVCQYFASVVVQKEDARQRQILSRVDPVVIGAPKPDKSERQLTNIGVRITSTPVSLAAGQSAVHSLMLYNGPKKVEELAQFEQQHLPLLIHYPDFLYLPIGAIARVMVWLLDLLYGLVHSYGIAIILMTVLVRLCMFPLSFKMAMSMQKMQALQPKLQELKDKYGKDKEKLNRAIMDLYAKNKVNPVGGCLPVFLQLPIFVGLYQSLLNSFNLRQSDLFFGVTWVRDLSAPDQLFPFGLELPFLGPQFNLLPILAVAQMVLNMRMSSTPATSPEMEFQKKIMNIMMIVMGFVFYKVPSGLCIYFITSGTWSMAERKLLPKPKTAPAVPATTAATETTGNGSPQWQTAVKAKGKKKGKTKR